MLLDSITLHEMGGGDSLYYQPEESLDVFKGEEAFGDWRLEMWDTRAGATNPVPILSAWQLRFVYETTTVVPVLLTYGVNGTNFVPAGQTVYFAVDVPGWVGSATNTLVSSTSPVNLLFNQFVLPTGTNAGDVLMLASSTGGIGSPILTPASTPPLMPGARYYLAVQNTGTNDATVAVRVDFDITPLSNGVPISSSIAAGALPRYFYYDVSSNSLALSFQLLNLSGNVDLVTHYGAPVPDMQNYDYGSFLFGTNDELITVFTNSRPVFLTPGRWYVGVFNVDITNVDYTIVATEVGNGPPNIIDLTNNIPYFNTNSAAGFASDYYHLLVTTITILPRRAQFDIDFPSGDMSLVVRKGLPLPSLTNYDLISINPDTNNEVIVLYDYSKPVALTPGDWYLTAVNVAGRPVSYQVMGGWGDDYGTNIVITNWFLASNSFCLTWTSITNAHYHVLGVTNFPDFVYPGFWVPASPNIIATNDLTTYCVPLPNPWSFFLVEEGDALFNPIVNTNAPAALSVTSSSKGSLVRFSANVNQRFQLQWIDSLRSPVWNTFGKVVTSTNGLYQFLDDGSQSGGLNPRRIYRAVPLH
jgi:hypothetical protein